MKKIIACLMACFAVFAFSACSLNKSGAPDSKGKEPLKIICTNFASYDFVRQIVGDKAEVTMLLKPGAEAHSYEPSPKDIQAIGKSDLFVYTGGDSDEWVDGILNSMDKSKLKTLKMMDTVKLYEEEMSEGMQEEEHEHEHAHLHHEHAHHHHHEHRNLFDVNKIIDESEIDEKAKDLAKRIFLRVAKAESKVHNETLENVHFHEVGAIDSIVDIIGTAILLCKINPDVIYSSVVNDGYGFIECAHGMISVPVPATSEIFAASNAITRQIDVDTELVTPTGAAIIAEIASEFTTMPAMNVQKVGWGTGTKDLVIPNVLKVSLGEIKKKTKL